MLATKKLTDRIKVEIKVQKGLFGYPGSPSQYYIAVVGSGPQLGHDNPAIAPRCTRIGNNVWMKEIWVKRDSLVSFNFLIVHGPTNTVFETEQVSPHRILVQEETVQFQARFNEADYNNERDKAQSPQSAEKNEEGPLKEEIQITEKDLRAKENNKSAGESNVAKEDITRNDESKTLDVNLADESNGENGDRLGNIRKDTKWQRDIDDMGQKIKFEKLLVDREDMIKVQLGVHQSVLDTYNSCVKAAEVFSERIGLKSVRQNQVNSTGDISHQELWVRKDLLEIFLTGENNGKIKLRITETELQRTPGITVTEVQNLKQSPAVMLRKTEAKPNSSFTSHKERSLSPAISALKDDKTNLQSIAKAARPGTSRDVTPIVNITWHFSGCYTNRQHYLALLGMLHQSSTLPGTSRDVTPIVNITWHFSGCTPIVNITWHFSGCYTNRQHYLALLGMLHQSSTLPGTSRDVTPIVNMEPTQSSFMITYELERQRQRKSPSTWTLRSCKKGLVLAAVGLGLATCLKAFVCR